MKRSRALQTAVFACGLVFTAAASADGHIASGAALGNTCAGCHGTNGQSVGPAPTIAGLSPDYFTSVMEQYRSGEARASGNMTTCRCSSSEYQSACKHSGLQSSGSLHKSSFYCSDCQLTWLVL